MARVATPIRVALGAGVLAGAALLLGVGIGRWLKGGGSRGSRGLRAGWLFRLQWRRASLRPALVGHL